MSMDFSWMHQELESRHVACTRQQLERAEAIARPLVSQENAALLERSEKAMGFERFLTLLLERLEPLIGSRLDPPLLAAELAPVLRPSGQSDRLWSAVLPGVREALTAFSAMGLRLAVVSNADGTVERALEQQGLRQHFELVVDSAVVGFEKPDPRIFAHALTALQCDPKCALHIGDMYFADVAGARSAGLHALLLDPFDDWHGVDCLRLPSLLDVRDHFLEVGLRPRGA